MVFIFGVFAIYNQEKVTLFGVFTTPLFVAVALGVIVGMIWSTIKMLKYKKEAAELKLAVKALNDNIDGVVSSELLRLASKYKDYEPDVNL
jgi:MFS superfamily sulfate permease-like transporter